MAACACNAASALWCAAGENSPAACAWAACNAAKVGSEAAEAAAEAATLAAVDAEEAETAVVMVGAAVVGTTVALVCVLRWDMRSSLDENLLPHTSLPFIQLQTCAEEDGDETEVVGGDAAEAADRETAEVGNIDGASTGGGKRPGGYANVGGLIPAAAAAAAAA